MNNWAFDEVHQLFESEPKPKESLKSSPFLSADFVQDLSA